MSETKKILIIQGGGRPKGHTVQLVGSFAKGALDVGHFVETASLLKNEALKNGGTIYE